MNITNKAISTKFLNIISRTNHVHTEIIMQYGGLRISVTCATTSCSNDSFALRRIEPINRWIKACGMLFHSCTSAQCSSCSVSGGFWLWRTRLPSSSHKCSIGDYGGHGRTRMWFWSRKTWQIRATWHLALSCWKTWSKFRCSRTKNIVSVFYGIQCSLNNFELSATIMTNSTPDPNTSASKVVGLVHTLVR